MEGPALTTGRKDASATGFRQWVTDFRTRAIEAGIPAATYDREMRQAEFLPDVITRDRSQNEFTKSIWDYLDIAVSDERIKAGQAALKRHAALLDRIEAEFGVERQVVVAIWGLESAFGSYRGTTDTVSALATLAYDGRRAAFFESQLIAALHILKDGHATRDMMRGSWAGAMGHTQFMPTSWAEFAVDFNGDGKRDIWSDDPADALASTARYLAHHGWQKGMDWGVELRLPAGFDFDLTSERVVKPVADWQAMGLRRADGGDLPGAGPASVLVPAGARGPAFLIRPNFQVIEAYNLADAYVIGIGHLSDRLRGAGPFQGGWPRDWHALTLAERKALQQGLTDAGHDTGGVDGRMGPKTVAAVKSWQKARGLVPDGYPSPDVLAALQGAKTP